MSVHQAAHAFWPFLCYFTSSLSPLANVLALCTVRPLFPLPCPSGHSIHGLSPVFVSGFVFFLFWSGSGLCSASDSVQPVMISESVSSCLSGHRVLFIMTFSPGVASSSSAIIVMIGCVVRLRFFCARGSFSRLIETLLFSSTSGSSVAAGDPVIRV